MALENGKQIEEFADKLTACADSIHDRLMDAIKIEKIDQYTAQSIFQDETILRQRAISLYIDAASCVVNGLSESQESIIGLIDKTKEKIKTIKKIAMVVDLVADLLVLAAAAYAAKPDSIIAALKEVKEDIEASNNA
jgi:4-hydroxy-3-methylbut-2-en-1-yl diphosphate synthase IspG/GcpE